MGGKRWLLRVGILSIFSGLQQFCACASPSINVALRASFNSAPYLLELLETAAEENSTAYFPLLDRIAEGYFAQASTDHELYTKFLQLLREDGHITDPDTLSSFQFALSIRSAAPRIEAYYQYYNSSVEPRLGIEQGSDCETWVEFDGKQYCSPELDKEQQSLKGISHHDLPFDRVLGNAGSGLVSTLYTDITSPSFGRFHRTISRTARNGQTSYRVRHKPSSRTSSGPFLVNGYGVELALKRTDYIVIDDRQAEEVGGRSDPPPSDLQNEEVADLKPLSASDLRGLGLKASSFVMASQQPLDTLLKLTQGFPKHSSSISAHEVAAAFLSEHYGNREIFLPPGYNVMWINGVQYDARRMDAFSLLDHLRRERKLINDVRGLGFTAPEAISILSHPAIAQAQADDEPQRYDYRDDVEGGHVIVWLNDIEKDKRYDDWPSSITALLQRTYPGQLPPVRRDIHNAIVPVDLADLKDVEMVAETLQNFVRRKVPVRWGIVPIINSEIATEHARVLYHLLETYGLSAAMSYLESLLLARKPSSAQATNFDSAIKGRKLRNNREPHSLQEVLQSHDLEQRINRSRDYLVRLGANNAGSPVFVNGAPITRSDEWLQYMSNRVSLDLREIQRGVLEEIFTEGSWLPSYFLHQSSLRRNPLIIPEDEKNITLLNLANIYADYEEEFKRLPVLAVDGDADKSKWAQMVVVADLGSDSGSALLSEAIQFRGDHQDVEIIFLHSGNHSVPKTELSARILRYSNQQALLSLTELEAASKEFGTEAMPLVKTLGFEPGQAGILLNGRLIGPIPPSMDITKGDLEALFVYESRKRIQPTAQAVSDLSLSERISSPQAFAMLSSLVSLSTISDVPEGIFESASTLRTSLFDQWNSTETAIMTGNKSQAPIQIVISVDPASEVAQRWVPILKVLSELSGIHTRIFLNPRDKLEEIPVKRFYRYVLQSTPSFLDNGALEGLKARFTGVPVEALLTMGMDVPPSWLVAPKESGHDLDNIKLSLLNGHSEIDVLYELESILIEGHSRDTTLGVPPRGTQLVLSTSENRHLADTIIMANLGYFQFKANPGFYNIELQPGRSEEIFRIDSAGTRGYSPQPEDESTEVALTSFQGLTLFPRLSRKPGQETADVLGASQSTVVDVASKGAAMADKLLSKAGLGSLKSGKYLSKALKFGSRLFSKAGLVTDVKTAAQADINIFSVASGHLYERMLNIMMVSVMKHTNHTVKFWFIEQFLSPSFKSFLPTLAAEYGFDYEMVTYKWPHWLRGQKEKQREIWGYKILFLDVLFPLDLDKVIFVDADQIVRTDMYELVTHDLQGAPYGFTPMCDSRTEMEGFRFWKQGYWKNFLRGLPYHISALYVVDLKRFRQIAAGDRLRQQYHQLSADPNSLSNLDQDLPNNMQMVLPIHSLPQEWLWCETWCSDESLKDAKTIDLCNNPLTKEPKLDRARRQVPEWTIYDEEIAALARRSKAADGEGEHAPIADRSQAEKDGTGSVQENIEASLEHGQRPLVRDEL